MNQPIFDPNDFICETTPEQDRAKEVMLELRDIIAKETDDVAAFQRINRVLEKQQMDAVVPDFPTPADRAHESARDPEYVYDIGGDLAVLNDTRYNAIRDGLIVLGGEAGMGKTSFMTQIIIELLRHHTDMAGLIITLDDSFKRLDRRIVSQVHKKNLLLGEIDERLFDDSVISRISTWDSMLVSQLKGWAGAVKRKHNAQKIVIGIDYLHIIREERSQPTQREYFNDVVSQLKDIQKALSPGCVMLLLSQFNRQVESMTRRYRETSEIENVAEVCIDITGKYVREIIPGLEADKKKRYKPAYSDPTRYIEITKNKAGDKATWKALFNTATLLFERLENTEDREQYVDAKYDDDDNDDALSNLR